MQITKVRSLAARAARPLISLVAVVLLLGPAGTSFARKSAGSSSSSSHSTSGRHSTSTSPAPKVHVRGYARKDGTYVAPHERSVRGNGIPKGGSSHGSTTPHLAIPDNGHQDFGGGRSASPVPQVHVRGYLRKDGTYVAPHERSIPGSGTSEGSSSRGSTNPHLTSSGASGGSHSDFSQGLQRDERGRIKRSEAAKDSFKRQHPCPSTSRMSGSCPGYVIDHIVPLCASGPDAAYNMQWQTLEQGKEKDRWERKECRVFPRK